MKTRSLRSRASGVTATALALALLPTLPGCATAQVPPAPEPPGEPSVVHVTGRGIVEVEPDRARIRFAVETEGEDASSAARSNAELMTGVLDALRSTGGEDLSLETRGFDVRPVYERNRSGQATTPRIVGYRVVNEVEVVTGDMEGIGELLDAGLSAGANRISGLSLFPSDSGPAREEAYRRAVADALVQARVMAQALGMELGDVVEIRGNVQDEAPLNRMRMEGAVAMADAPTPIEGGTTTVAATVTATFRLAH